MNFNIVRAVWRRDLRSWFGNPTGWVFIVLFVLLSTIALMVPSAFFANNLANLETLNTFFPYIAALFIAASTMNSWASERANGTQELLFTLPGSDVDLQLGKFLAAATVYTVSLLFTLVLPIALMLLGNPDWGQLFANYFGYWLFGVMLVAVSMVGSQVSHNATIALIVSLMFCAVVVFFGYIAALFGFRSWLANGPLGQFALFGGGEVPLSGVLLFVGMTVAFFYLGLALLGRRHWRGEEGMHGGLRFASLACGALALTVVGVQYLPRVDVTSEGIHSLSEESEKLLAGLDRDKPVYITAYVSEEVPEQFVQQKKLLLNLVDQFDAIGGTAVEKSVIIPEPFSPEAREAETNFGIKAQPVTMPLAGGGVAEIQMYLGFAVQCGTEEVVTPFVGPAIPLEYELMRSIRTVSKAERRTVGILKTDVELFGGFDMQTFQQKPRWAIAQELEQQYDIENVDPASDYPDTIDCLIVPQPSSLEQEPMDRLREWIAAGNPTILFEDPVPVGAPGTAYDDKKGGMQAQMMGGGGPEKGNFNGFCNELGLRVPLGEVVWDLSYSTFPAGRQLNPEIVFVRGGGVSSDSVITSGLQSVVSMMGGHVQDGGRDGVKFTPLLRTRGSGSSDQVNGVVRKSELFQRSFFGTQMNPNPPRERRVDDLVLAASFVGAPAEGAAKGINLIYVADLDLIGNQFFQLRSQLLDPNLRFDNVTFALNCIDTLVGDESLIALRKRRPILRKLTAVEEAQRVFEDAWQKQKNQAEKDAKESLDAAQARFDAAVAAIRNDEALDEQAKQVKIVEVQQNENRKLDLEKAQIEEKKQRRLEEAQHDRDASERGIHNRYRVVTLLLSIIPGVLLGLATWVRRSMRASSIVPQSRHVSGVSSSNSANQQGDN